MTTHPNIPSLRFAVEACARGVLSFDSCVPLAPTPGSKPRVGSYYEGTPVGMPCFYDPLQNSKVKTIITMSKEINPNDNNIENLFQPNDAAVLTTVKKGGDVAEAIAASSAPVVKARIIHPKTIVETDKNAPVLDPKVVAEMLAKEKALLSSPLTDEERSELNELKDHVRQGLDCARYADLALREIRDRRLFREMHASFEEYCRSEFDLSEQRVSQRIKCAEEIAALKGRVGDELLEKLTERAVRALRSVKKENKVVVLTLAAELSKKGTPDSTSIEQARVQIEGAKPEKTKQDAGVKADVALKAAQQLKEFLEKGDVKKMTLNQLDDLKMVIGEIAEDSKKLNRAA